MTRFTLAALLCAAACDHSNPLPTDGLSAPPGLADLSATPMRLGADVTFSATDMPPGEPVYFIHSLRGQGTSCPSVLRGDCMDLVSPLRVLGIVDADRRGIASLTLTVPPRLALSEVHVQAVHLGTANNTFSNAVTTPVLPPTIGPTCDPDDLPLLWPMLGQDAQDWVINNYVDLDSTSGIRDYRGGGKSYDGHNGIDIDVSTFREMDNDTPIIASAPGEVIDVRADNFDRNMSCTGNWNVVTVRHDNGFVAFYGHLKRNSPVVSVGDRVETGDMLGVVGSSGCSSHAHLHFELHDCSGNVVDPFRQGMWTVPPAYTTTLDVMDTVIRIGGLAQVEQIKDPDPNATSIAPNTDVGIGLSMAGGRSGDRMEVRLRDPGGSVRSDWSRTLSNEMRHHFWIWNTSVGSQTGSWTVEVLLNGVLRRSTPLRVTSTGPDRHDRCYSSATQRVCWNIDASDYQAEFNSAVAAGFRPVWVDVSSRSDGLVYNAIFKPSAGTRWVAWHGLDGGDHQDAFNSWTAQGFHITHVDGAMSPSGMRYTAVAEAGPTGGWASHHGINGATHQQLFDDYADAGLRAVNVAVAADGSDVRISSLYDDEPVGGWVQNYNIAVSDYQDYFNTWTGAGMWVSYVDAYLDDGWRLSVALDSRPTFGAAARHGVRSGPMFASIRDWEESGVLVETLSTYGNDPDPVYILSAARR